MEESVTIENGISPLDSLLLYRKPQMEESVPIESGVPLDSLLLYREKFKTPTTLIVPMEESVPKTSLTKTSFPKTPVTLKTPLVPTTPPTPILQVTPPTPILQATPTMPLAPTLGKTLESYENLKVLGQGAFGKVFKVREIKTGKIMALKVIEIKNQTLLRQTQKEIDNLRKISTPNCNPYLICYYGAHYIPSKKLMLIEMEYIDGVQLDYWVKNFNGTKNELYGYLLAIMIKILKGLQYVHNNGLIHKDIKPANILLTQVNGEYIPKLVDFGLSCQVHKCVPVFCCKSYSGTPIFMAPETIKSGTNFFSSDIWSLGVTFFFLASGRYPFNFTSNEISSVLNIIVTNTPFTLQTSNTKLNNVVNGMLKKDPLERPRIDQILEYLL